MGLKLSDFSILFLSSPTILLSQRGSWSHLWTHGLGINISIKHSYAVPLILNRGNLLCKREYYLPSGTPVRFVNVFLESSDDIQRSLWNWFEDTDSEYLIHRSNGEKFKYDNYHKKRFQPLMEQLGMDHTPHCCRYTCSSMMHKAEIRETIRKKILGHSQDLINDTYTQLDIDEIVNAINLI